MTPPPKSPDDIAENKTNPPSSPTSTIRNVPVSLMQPVTEASTESEASTPLAGPGDVSGMRGTTAQQQKLGMGRPGGGSNVLRPAAIQHQTSPVHPSSPLNARASRSPGRAASIRSYGTTDDEDIRPRTAAVGMSAGEQTPRGGGSQRGVPQTAFPFGSPGGQHAQMASGGSSAHRPPRAARYNTATAFPVSHPVNPVNASHTIQSAGVSGSISRSASRARAPLHSIPAAALAGPAGPAMARALGIEDDDEAEIEDRGQALIRRRQKERKQLRRAKEKGREKRLGNGEDATPDTSAPPSGLPDDTFGTQQARGAMGRSVSRARTPSANRQQPSDGYFHPYARSEAGYETPREEGLSPMDELRPASVYSSTADEEEVAPQDRASLLDDVVAEVIVEQTAAGSGESDEEEEDAEESGEGDEAVTLKDRQDAINIEHPFGLPIWKPALYRKSRSITRNAESALHSIPSAAAEWHLLPGNILWLFLFGWWLAIACFFVAMLVSGAEGLGGGRGGYGKTLRGLAWYIGWPYGKYVEGEGGPDEDEDGKDEDDKDSEEEEHGDAQSGSGSPVKHRPERLRDPSDSASSGTTVRDARRNHSLASSFEGLPDEPRPGDPQAFESAATIRPSDADARREPTVSFAPIVKGKAKNVLRGLNGNDFDEHTPLLPGKKSAFRRPTKKRANIFGRILYWPSFVIVVVPLMLFVCVICWGLVITIPMAKLTWELVKLLYLRPLQINFLSAPKVPVPTPHVSPGSGDESGDTTLANGSPGGFTMKSARLTAGQVAPTPGYESTVLLCTNRAIGLRYYKYTIGGVNIIFINLVPLVFFTIIDGFFILPAVEKGEAAGRHYTPLITFLTSQALIFVLALASVIPLSYFIGMAVASISAQSSIGMGAVINATFGSVIEVILYGIALTQGKGRLVEGSIVGSILAGVLLMPGASMCSGALKRKEQKFNAKSAGVTSTMLIMAIIGTLTPTMFYQTYGSFELHCQGCPDPGKGPSSPDEAWMCDHCYYEHPDPASDSFYQEKVKTLMYGCAVILLLSYLIGLWFSLRTHASQIWQNPQQLMKAEEAQKASALLQRMTPNSAMAHGVMSHILPVHKQGGTGANSPVVAISHPATLRISRADHEDVHRNPSNQYSLPAGYTPFLESMDRDMKTNHLTPMRLPSTLTTEDFTRAVAVATVSALRHQGSIIGSHGGSGHKPRPVSGTEANHQGGHEQGNHEQGGQDEEQDGGGHEAPSWTRGFSACVLLGCTLLYAMIAEILVDVVDVVLAGSGIDEKFLGLSMFALVPNTTEFMNAMSFAMNGNIALSMEIGSAYALQVCLLQIPAMVAFSAFYDPGKMGDVVDTFTLIFPRWDVIAIILSIFLLTYTYIEARSNYHRGSILVLAYVVLMMGFYFAPPRSQGDPDTSFQREKVFGEGIETAGAGFWAGASKLYAKCDS